jgi:ribosomal protein S18 acetylase RimI-like enzyme
VPPSHPPSDAPPVRPARPADAPAIRRLQSLLAHPAPALLDAALDPDAPVGSVRVATAEGVPVGYCLVVGPGGGAGVHVAEVAVAPAYRRAGLASALFADVFARVDGPVTAVVAAADDDARAFYDALGFAVAARLPDRFPDGAGLRLVARADGERPDGPDPGDAPADGPDRPADGRSSGG